MSELRHRRGEGDGNDKVETAGESDHVAIFFTLFRQNPFEISSVCCDY